MADYEKLDVGTKITRDDIADPLSMPSVEDMLKTMKAFQDTAVPHSTAFLFNPQDLWSLKPLHWEPSALDKDLSVMRLHALSQPNFAIPRHILYSATSDDVAPKRAIDWRWTLVLIIAAVLFAAAWAMD